MAFDAILSRKGPVTRAMSKRLQEDWARATKEGPRVLMNLSDAILPRKGLVTRAMSKRLQEDWAIAAEEGPRVLMSLRVDF